MSDALTTFFEAWSITDATERSAKIAAACSADITYSDPRSGGRLAGHDAVSDYVAMFSANAPGWTASVVSSDEVNGYARSIVAFGGMGPDGSLMVQHGTYFSDAADGKLTMIAGFVGTGAPE
ncbi:nuclear transport factor 2 family protein [Octadecabacter sp. G9-8]|uniref:Nuclear transport factor 2 family protein n=1 Tax=Octadecabacter dasysiphoniae TaxID=2909341 RepID=A0ABS9CQV2_9RHOB|nr:nuclear transport factor 2 family protein [Octadecabacter dasysiphoniae]MCF2869618.1 nuclear transport factor 2 family protein [Octadecabacter dasysiphoniae]